ncbi:hypothetical protein O9929_26305 [Vibrio lentus]|nr:hypothetical protein [Vibrio lentus]
MKGGMMRKTADRQEITIKINKAKKILFTSLEIAIPPICPSIITRSEPVIPPSSNLPI